MKAASAASDWQAAARLRHQIKRLLDTDTGQIILTPSSLVALRLIFAALNVQKLLMTKEEYYTPSHFPGIATSVVPTRELAHTLNSSQTDAAIMSVVTWQGRRLDIETIFSGDGAHRGRKSPLRIADGSHIGAAGWPSAEQLNADIVFGDPARWIARPVSKQNLGFIWLRSKALWKQLVPFFAPFYLALETPTRLRQSRWIDPKLVHRTAKYFAALRLNRTSLCRRHIKNMSLASTLAQTLGIPAPNTAIVWLPRRKDHKALQPFRRSGLLWAPSSGGTRVMCWADSLRNR